jgi:NADPH:quinone reductase
MAKAIRISTPGGAEVLSWDDIEVPAPGTGQVQLRQTAVGLNYIDVYHRTGLYPLPSYPAPLGLEGCGVVEAVGEGVTHLRAGDRVAYGHGPVGAYAERRTLPASICAKVPDAISDIQAAAMMVQGITAHFLLRRAYRLQAGDACLVHAAAGGVGTLLCQWARHLGATVIGTVGSDAKAQHAKDHGCHHTILYSHEDIAARVRDITSGEGVAVAYDSVGKDTFEASLDSLRTFGTLVSFGQASGPVPPFDVGVLAAKGSLYLTRPSYMNYTQDNGQYHQAIEELFALVGQGVLKAEVGQTYALKDAATAHRDLEARKTKGATVLVVG